MSQTITEASRGIKEIAGKPGRFLVELITPGEGSSGIYPQECLEQAGADGVFAKGTHMYLDHPTATEEYDRPGRSVKDLGAVLAEDAYWNGTALVAEAQPFSQHAGLLNEMAEYIGVSIRASAEIEEGVGRPVIKKIVAAESVDFVTHAGRGGSFRLLESARPSLVNARAQRHRNVSEATVNDQREALQNVLKDAYGSDNTYVWLRDFDGATAWFEISTSDTEQTFAQPYTAGDDDLPNSMTGDRTEVRQVTQYVPVHPAGQSTQESLKEDTMAATQIEESALAELREKAGRVSVLESERDTAVKERDEAVAENATLKVDARKFRATELIGEAAKARKVTFTALETKGLLADLPLDKDGHLDEAAVTKAADEAAATILEEGGAGRIHGFGGSTPTGGISEAEFAQGLRLTKIGA